MMVFMSESARDTTAPRRVNWRRVLLFYGMALGWVIVVALALQLAGQGSFMTGAMSQLAVMVIAVFYMPAPLVSALIVDRLDGRRPLITTTFAGFGRKLPKLLLAGTVFLLVTLVAMLALSWLLGSLLGVPGVGRLIADDAGLVANIETVMGAPADSAPLALPGVWVLLGLVMVASIVAGFTTNGLFAFGEEYGWRGWLADELRPLGAVRANLLTGVMWGLWHTPLILQGFNFYPYNYVGPVFMVLLCIPFSFLLWRVRDLTGSLLAPAVLHGIFNAFIGIFVVALVDRNPLVGAPVGVVGAAAVAIVAMLFWLIPARTA